jgi:hypothetical protein
MEESRALLFSDLRIGKLVIAFDGFILYLAPVAQILAAFMATAFRFSCKTFATSTTY